VGILARELAFIANKWQSELTHGVVRNLEMNYYRYMYLQNLEVTLLRVQFICFAIVVLPFLVR
jgi:hypothetical protein